MPTAVRAVLLGAATGGRSMTGLAAVALATPAGTCRGWLGWLANPWGRVVVVAAAAGELVADKSPKIPSRLAPAPLAARVALGALAAAALARRDHMPVGLPVALAGAATVGGSVAGAAWRRAVPRRGGLPLAAAIAEDAVTIALAALACAPPVDSRAAQGLRATARGTVVSRRDGWYARR
jgi:uncharacterized membrane protein